jgi:hypothetical protein
MAESCAALQKTVNTLLEKDKAKETEEENPLKKFAESNAASPAASGRESTPSIISEHRNIGVPSKDVGHVDLVSTDIRKKILKGEDVNMCALLIPAYETAKKDQEKSDKRLNRNLTISEFVTAFCRFKRIMCTTYPWRQEELDQYLAHIIEVHNVWPTKFFEYHKLFAAKCAIALKQNQVLINWSKGDEDILKRVVAGADVSKCNFCSSTTHSSSMCTEPQEDRNENVKHYRSVQRKDKYDRNIAYHEGKQVCNNFNFNRCSVPYCRRAHVCANCMATTHGKQKCPSLNLEKSISKIVPDDNSKKQKNNQ